MDATTRNSVILAAVTATGPETAYTQEIKGKDGSVIEVAPDPAGYEAALVENAIKISLMLDEKSKLAKAIEQVQNSKTFVGTVVAVAKEQSSQRGIITLHTGTDKTFNDAITKSPLPAGCEQVRTERTDSNELGRRMALRARDLKGHRVVVKVEIEQMSNGNGNVRVLRHIESLGLDTQAEAKIAAAS